MVYRRGEVIVGGQPDKRGMVPIWQKKTNVWRLAPWKRVKAAIEHVRVPFSERRGGAWSSVYDWRVVDWRMSDAAIAHQLGCARERVRQKRIEDRRPQSPLAHLSVQGVAVGIWMLDHRDEPRTSAELAEQFGVTTVQVESVARRVGYKLVPPPPRPPRLAMRDLLPINWDLPNPDIERIWKRPFNWAANVRTRTRKPKSRWNGRMHLAGDAAYHAAIKAEQRKATAFFRTPEGRRVPRRRTRH